MKQSNNQETGIIKMKRIFCKPEPFVGEKVSFDSLVLASLKFYVRDSSTCFVGEKKFWITKFE